jgi:hypothetical protein
VTRPFLGLAVVIALGVAVGLYVRSAPLGADYADPNCGAVAVCDDSSLSIDALADGRVGRFFAAQPPTGPLSLLARAPAVALVRARGGTVVDEYRAGALVCMLALVAFGTALALVLKGRGAPMYLVLIGAAACVITPVTGSVLFWGHPEDFVGGALAVGAVILALSGWPAAAGVALGLGVATKLWVLFVAIPVLAAMPRRVRVRAALLSMAAAAALIVPMAVGNPDAFWRANTQLSKDGSQPGALSQASAWWVVGHDAEFTQIETTAGVPHLVRHEGWVLPRGLARLALPGLAAICLGLGLLWWLRTRDQDRRVATALALAALVLLVRSPLDPANHSYTHLPFFLALVSWETVSRRRLPVVTALAMLGLQLLRSGPGTLGDGLFNAVYLTGVGALAGYLCIAVFGGWGTVARDGTRAAVHRAS